LGTYQYSDTEGRLQNFHDELVQMAQGRIRIYSEETAQTESFISDMENYEFSSSSDARRNQIQFDNSRPPLPSKLFAKELTHALDVAYDKGVYGTGKRVVRRLLADFKKEKRDQECQTATIKDLTGAFERTI